jgi:hypothetical protein
MNPRTQLLIGTLVLSVSCAPPAPTPIAPTQLHSGRTPTEAVQVATRELVAQGFEVSVSDAAAGTVVVKRVRSPDAQGDDITCRYAHGSMAGRGAEATMTVNVSAKAGSSGSDVVLTSLVRTDFSRMPGIFAQQASNDTDCVSSGLVEKQLADALR